MLIVSKNIEIIYQRIGDHQYKGALFCNANRALISIIGFTISKKKRKVLLATCNMFFRTWESITRFRFFAYAIMRSQTFSKRRLVCCYLILLLFRLFWDTTNTLMTPDWDRNAAYHDRIKLHKFIKPDESSYT